MLTVTIVNKERKEYIRMYHQAKFQIIKFYLKKLLLNEFKHYYLLLWMFD